MILEVRLSNLFSIKDEVVLDLRAGNIQTKQAKELQYHYFAHGKDNVLKSAAIYGANASGKSNVIKAIRFCCRMIFNSHTHNEDVSFNPPPEGGACIKGEAINSDGFCHCCPFSMSRVRGWGHHYSAADALSI